MLSSERACPRGVGNEDESGDGLRQCLPSVSAEPPPMAATPAPVPRLVLSHSTDGVMLRILVQRLLGDGGHGASTIEIEDRVSAARALCSLLMGPDCAATVKARFRDICATLSQVRRANVL